MKMNDNKITLKELITEYGLPLDVKKSWWFGDYYFRAEKLQRTGMISGTVYKDGEKYESKSFSQSEIMQLLNPEQAPKASKESKKKASTPLPNPNKLDLDISHYTKGETKLFVKKGESVKPAIFDHFDEEKGQVLIYVIQEGETKPGFYLFPQTKFVFPNKDDARSKIDKEARRFGMSPSRNIVSAFKKMPKSRKPSENTSEEHEYERGYHKNVDGKLKDDLRVPEEKKREAQYDLAHADEELREEIVAARENKYIIDDHTIISHKMRKETADTRIFFAQKEISRLEGIRTKPYFARIDCGESMRDLHTVYLGNDDIDGYVVSWRNAEYGNAYYQSAILQGREDIVLALKRIVDITYGNFNGYEDEISLYAAKDIAEIENKEVVEGKTDELLNRLLLESRADKQVHDIIKTIQSEQYDIITSDFRQNAVINGCAGSGKTMIMYHRLSYMAYNYQAYLGKTFDPNFVYIVSPSSFFDSSNDELLTKLSIDSVYQAPFGNLVDKLLDLYCSKKLIVPFYGLTSYVDAQGEAPTEFFSASEFNTFNKALKDVDESSLAYKQWVVSLANQFLSQQEFKEFDFDTVPVNANEVSSIFASSDYYYNECFVKKNSKESKFYSKQAITGISLENVITSLNRKYGKTSTQYKQRTKKINKYLPFLRCCLTLKTKRNFDSEVSTDIADFWNLLDNTKAFEKMISIILAEKLLECILAPADAEMGYILSCLYVYKNMYGKQQSEEIKLYFLRSLSKKYGSIVSEDALIFVDEFQNYSAFELQCLKEAYESPVFNLFGDYDQRIEDKGASLKSKLKSILDDPNAYNINVNYRNAKQITEFINQRVHKNMQSIGVNGTVTETALAECDFKVSNRTAIICKDSKTTLMFLKRYVDAKLINDATSTKEIIADKYTLMTVADCKGLEFDTVYVFDYGMTDNEKYVAYTRALDALVVISDDLDAIKKAEEAAERKRKEDERIALEARKKEEDHQKYLVEKQKAEREFNKKQNEAREAEEKKKQNDQRKQEENKKKETYVRCFATYNKSSNVIELTEAIVLLGTIADWQDSKQLIEKIKNKIADIAANEQKQKYRLQKVCQYCGGSFKGLFVKTCRSCGKKKDY